VRPGGGHEKGASFEREVCKQLSSWWTGGERDDVFWRTPQSGGRATRRAQKGQKTAGHYGDILAVDHVGQPLIDFMTFELKCGYPDDSFADLLDGTAKSQWFKWIQGAIRVRDESGSKYWGLVVKRARRETVICVPEDFYLDEMDERVIHRVTIGHPTFEWVTIFRFSDFIEKFRPSEVYRRKYVSG